MVIQNPHGLKRVQVKSSGSQTNSVRVRELCSPKDGLEPEDCYDLLAVVNLHRLWLIPATALSGRRSITIKPQDINCPFAGYRRR